MVFTRMTDEELRGFSEISKKVIADDTANRSHKTWAQELFDDAFVKFVKLIELYVGGENNVQ